MSVIDDAKEVGGSIDRMFGWATLTTRQLEAMKTKWRREALEEANHEKLLNELNRIKKDLCSGRGGGGCSN